MSVERKRAARCCSHFSQILHIFLDLTNLAEQLAVYFILKDLKATELEQRTFFFIILSIGLVSCIISGVTKLFLATFLSILVEIGELLAYMLALPRSTTLIVVASILSGVEIFLHITMMIINYCTEEAEETTDISSTKHNGSVLSFLWHLLFYVIYNTPSTLYLFLAEDSLFRETFYEILILLNVFVSGLAIEIYGEIVPSRWKNRGWRLLSCSINLVWYIILRVTGTILFGFVIPISGWILAAKEVKKRVDNNNFVANYDTVIYIISLVFFVLIVLGNWYILYHIVFGIRNHFCVKVDPYLSQESPSKADNNH